MSLNESKKIVDCFITSTINIKSVMNNIKPNNFEKYNCFINKIEIVKMTGFNELNTVHKNNQTFIRLKIYGDYWLKLYNSFEYNRNFPPITNIKIINCEKLNDEYMVRK